MFFVPDIFARKGPLAVVWLAAHFEKKLSKNQIQNTSVTAIIEIIMNSNIKISLRTTSDLMIGLCRISNFQCKYLLDSSQNLLSANAFMTNYLKMGKKKKRKSIDLPDESDYIIKNLNIPEIFEFIDLNLPEYKQVAPVNRGSITMEEIPPLTDEEIQQEKEIEQRIYGLDNIDDGDFFDDILPPAKPSTPSIASQELPLSPPHQLSLSPSEPMPLLPSQTMSLSPTQPIPLAPAQPLPESFDLSPISGQPPRDIIDIQLSTDKSGSKRKTPVSVESVEKRRKQISDSTGLFGNIQLEDLDDTSNITGTFPRRIPRRRYRPVAVRRNRLVVDQITKLSNFNMRQNLHLANINMKIPDIFIPSKKLISKNINEPFRALPQSLLYLFTNSKNNIAMNEDFDPIYELSNVQPVDYNNNNIDLNNNEIQLDLSQEKADDLKSSEIKPPLTTTIEPVDDFFDVSLPPPPPLSPPPSPPPSAEISPEQLPPADNYDDLDSLPQARDNLEADSDISLPTIPELTSTERSIFADKLNHTLNNLFSNNDILTFEQLSIPDNKKITAAIYFYNLLQMTNNGIINLYQEPSMKQFNSIYITMRQNSSSESI